MESAREMMERLLRTLESIADSEVVEHYTLGKPDNEKVRTVCSLNQEEAEKAHNIDKQLVWFNKRMEAMNKIRKRLMGEVDQWWVEVRKNHGLNQDHLRYNPNTDDIEEVL